MTSNEGPSPDKILEGIKLEEAQRNKGRLKIFLGMAAGVGKTYAMLEEAHVLRKEQIDVVVGNIDAHARTEIEVMLKNLPQIPKKIFHYEDKEFKELDVDAIISLKPSIVLVDELAHSNLPGSKHEKRWQDVLELLDHGISVHTTLNVQHIESLNDVIFGITEFVVKETVPDMVIEQAHSIQLIDLTPDELLQRLKEGKVYTEAQSKIAVLNFFQKNKLAALREIALRYVADRIDIDLMCMITTKEGRIEWKTHEKFLVAIGESPHSQKLIKATRRLATQANAPWIAVYVHTGKTLSKEQEERLDKWGTLTRDLGAELITINDPDVAEGIKRIAYQRDITQIILGRSPRKIILSLFQGPTLLDKLTVECKNIDLHVIRQDVHTAFDRKTWPSFASRAKSSDYLFVSFWVCLIASFSWIVRSLVGYRVAEFLFFIGVSALGVFFPRGPAILAAVLFGLIWAFVFPFPWAESSVSTTDELLSLALYVVTAIGFGIFVERTWKQKHLLRTGSQRDSQLADVLKCLQSHADAHEVLSTLEERLPKIVEGTYKFVIKKDSTGSLDMDNIALSLVGDKERLTAIWAFENGCEAGWSTGTLPLSENLYIPLKGHHKVMGLLIYRSPNRRTLTKDQRKLLDNVCQKLSSYLES